MLKTFGMMRLLYQNPELQLGQKMRVLKQLVICSNMFFQTQRLQL